MTEKADDAWRGRVRFSRRCTSLACFVMAVLSLSVLFGGWFCSVRSSNSLDDLYYATIDSNAYSALLNGFSSPDVLLSALSAVKEQDVRVMPSVDMSNKGSFTRGIPELPLGISSGLTYSFSDKAAKKAGAASIGWSAWDGWSLESSGRHGLSFFIGFPASRYGTDARGTAFLSVEYDIENKVLRCSPYKSISFLKNQDYSGGSFLSDDEYAELHDIRLEEMADDAISIVKDVLMPEFVNRRGSYSKFSSDFEQDGVTVDVDLSRDE